MIRVEQVSKVFKIPHENTRTLFHKLLSFTNRGYTYEEMYALKNVTLDVSPGEFIGIIGRNGSGKTTLLRIIAGIYPPTSGSVTVKEEISPLMELGLGFDDNFSCLDNIYVYGALLGFTRKQMARRVDEILAFAELGKFADARLANLSSGMRVRLAFSIAIQSVAPIILVDEVLAVGDSVFNEKCMNAFKRFKAEGRTIILVSHSMEAIKEFSDTVFVMDQGVLVNQGAPEDMVKYYAETVLHPKDAATRPGAV